MKILAAAFGVLVFSFVFGPMEVRAQSDQETENRKCSVSGRVVNEKNGPVAEAFVKGILKDAPPEIRHLFAITNEKGLFSFKAIKCGTYMFFAEKEEDNYPLVEVLSDAEQWPSVEIKDGVPLTDLEIMVGPKSPRLKITLTDAKTGKQVKSAALFFHRFDNPDIFLGPALTSKGEFDLLTPLVPFKIRIESPGYWDWHYKEGDNQTNPVDFLTLSPGKTRELKVSLEPKS